jgi:hypothetical protein
MDGIGLITRERLRQMTSEGHTLENDDKRINGELAIAAACYAVAGIGGHGEFVEVHRLYSDNREGLAEDAWPWEPETDKREAHPRLRRLVIAGALIAAEIDRLQRVVVAADAASPE